LSTQFDGIKFSSFTPTAATLAANAKATAENANRGNKDTTFNPTDIGQAAASNKSIIADSLAKVGGGGFAVGPSSNPILEESRKHTAYLARIADASGNNSSSAQFTT
jgi:hypothetical protein